MSGIRVAGWGHSLPEGVITNEYLAERFGVDEKWILDRTGVKERRTGSTTNQLAVEAGRAALEDAGIEASEIDTVIVATCTATQTTPATASFVQAELGIPTSASAFDLNGACSGFNYGLVLAAGLNSVGSGNCLLIGSETLTTATNYDDRNTAILFGDGAGAAVVVRDDTNDLIAYDMRNNPEGFDALTCEPGGVFEMEGRDVFSFAVTSIIETVNATLATAGISLEDIDVIVPHQANVRILASAWRTLGLDMDKTVLTIADTGNTSAASIPVAMDCGIKRGEVKPGDLVLLVGFGAGVSACSILLRHRG